MQIVCRGLNDEDFQVEFVDHKIFMGRDATNGVVILAEGVSRCHAILIEEGNELFLQDNGSRNGTILNYNVIRSRQKLSDGDIIQIGLRLIKVDFYPDKKVVLDFVPPEQTETVHRDFDDAQDVDPAPADEMPPDGVERTMRMSDTTPPVANNSSGLFAEGGEIGKYEIVRRLGKGGMGEVYLAKHKTLGIYRALKVLSKDESDDNAKFLNRFIREAKLASEIRHPNVVGVMDVETDNEYGIPYIVMEYVDGGSLRNSLATSGKLSEEQAVVIVEAIASALKAAEEHNIVHRDIKPDNIMFTSQGNVKLADLGIAKSVGSNVDLTKTNMMIGTPAYLPPEQARNAKGVDCRADIYSLGATFYEMLTGQPPYSGENTIEILHKLFLSPVPDPRKINPEISTASAAIVMKMIAKDPKNRFRNADDLLETMERAFPAHTPNESAELIRKVIAGDCENNATFSSGIVSSHLSLWWLKMRNRGLVLSAIGLILGICILGGMFLFLDRRAEKPVPDETPVEAPVPTLSNPEPDTPETQDSGIVPEPQSQEENGDASSNSEDEPKSPDSGIVPEPQSQEENGDASSNSEDEPEPIPVQKTTFKLDIRTNPDSNIYLTRPDGKTTILASGEDGHFSLSDLEKGGYRVRIEKNSYIPTSYDFDLEDDVRLVLHLSPDTRKPLLVNTDRDVVDSLDELNSLREALNYAQSHADATAITFARDFTILLNSPLTISNNISIDGGTNKITIITGPKTGPMFRILGSRQPSLTLKNLTLISDHSGRDAGILSASSDRDVPSKSQNETPLAWLWDARKTVPPGLVHLNSVKDGGSAERLWNFSGVGVLIEGTSRLHRLVGTNAATVRIGAESTLEDSSLAGVAGRADGDFMVFGTLKNSSVSDFGDICVFRGGKAQNITVKKGGFIEGRSGGTINGMTVDFGAVCGCEKGSSLTGTISIGGVAIYPEQQKGSASIADGADIVFDLTERTGKSGFSFSCKSDQRTYEIRNSQPPHPILDGKAFSNARSYAIKIKENQAPGSYILAEKEGVSKYPMDFEIGNNVYKRVLYPGNRISLKNKSYFLSSESGLLVLLISNIAQGEAGSAVGTTKRLRPELAFILSTNDEIRILKVEAGTFIMGEDDGQGGSNEKPHMVTLKNDYYIGKTEVTQAQWKAVMKKNPSSLKHDSLPVESVSWDDAQEFCKKLNSLCEGKLPAGYHFDLPTEAQWEFAARGGIKSHGTMYSGSHDLNFVGWFAGNSGNNRHQVGTKLPNELGIYDMSGGVREWCRDWYESGYADDPEFLNGNFGTRRVNRGGSWKQEAKECRVAGGRSYAEPGSVSPQIGFRVALVPIR